MLAPSALCPRSSVYLGFFGSGWPCSFWAGFGVKIPQHLQMANPAAPGPGVSRTLGLPCPLVPALKQPSCQSAPNHLCGPTCQRLGCCHRCLGCFLHVIPTACIMISKQEKSTRRMPFMDTMHTQGAQDIRAGKTPIHIQNRCTYKINAF